MQEFLSHMFCVGQRYVATLTDKKILHPHINMVLYRYSITQAIGKSHLILGKISEPSVLTPDDIAAIQERTSFCQQTAKLYHRVIISGTMYTSSAYTRSKITNDSILSFKGDGQKQFGCAKCYVSFCTNDCLDCPKLCKHMVIVELYRILPVIIGTDKITGATAQHIRCVQPLRYIYFIVLLP